MIVVEGEVWRRLESGDLIAIQDEAGTVVAARWIGPVAGEPPLCAGWRLEGRYRVDDNGVPISEIAPATSLASGATRGHDWGALGLPDGLDTRVRPVDDHPGADDLSLARASSGFRRLDNNPLLSLAPGDRVAVAGKVGTVVSIDRRKRVVEIDRAGDVTVHEFDDVQMQETT